MPYVPVPKDLAAVKTKVAFNLTKRQLICFGLAAVVAVPTYFAMYEKDGQPAEKILRNFIRSRFLTPRVRPYRTNNLYSALMKQSKLDKEVSAIVGKQDKKIHKHR